MLPDRSDALAMPPSVFSVGPYSCMPLAETLPARVHVGGAVVRREVASGTCETRLLFDEENFDTPEEALAYAAARADFLLRFNASRVVPF